MLHEIEPPVVEVETEYPDSDGEPMGETGFHVILIVQLISLLRAFFRHRSDVYVGGNMFVYYQEGDNKHRVAPDVFVAFGVLPHERRSWLTWNEGKGSDVVFEFTSRATRAEDQGSKKGLYEWLGVREYFVFDPLGDYLRPQLQGYRLIDDQCERLPMSDGQLESEQLGLRLKPAGQMLDLFDAKTGQKLLPLSEMADVVNEAEDRIRRESEARQAAEAEVARLREELARLRGQ